MIGKSFAPAWSGRLVFVSGAFSALLGISAIVAWHARYAAFLKLFPAFEAMRYNTALGFLISGSGLVLVSVRLTRLARLCGILALLLGAFTLFQYITGTDLGIDQLLLKDEISEAYKGRMAISSALAFVFIGTVLALSGSKVCREHPGVPGLLGIFTISLGLTAIFGYIAGISSLNTWGGFVGMALNTALGFVVAGAGLIAAVPRKENKEAGRAIPLLPVAASIAVFTGTLLLWRFSALQDSMHLDRTIAMKAAAIRDVLKENLESRVMSLDRMAARWEVQGRPLKKQWEVDAGLYISHYKGYRSLQWMNNGYMVGWAVPEAQGIDLAKEASVKEIMAKARDIHEPRLAPVRLDAGYALAAFVPIYVSGRFDGFIAGVFDSGDTMEAALLHEFGQGFSISVSHGKEELFSRIEVDTGDGASGQVHEQTVDLYGSRWVIKVWPSKTLIRELQSYLPNMILAMGMTTSFLLSLTLYFAQTASSRAKAAEAANVELEKEVAERKRLEEEAEKHAEELERWNEELEKEVAERKKAEEGSVRHAMELARSNAELEQFAYVASHDLQEPLRVISGYVQLLSRRYKGKLDSDADEFINFAVDGAARMQRLITDLLAYSRVGRSVELVPSDFNSILDTALGNLKSSIDESTATVTARGPMPSLTADPTRMGQLFQNLISNALKYRSANPPRIEISAEQRTKDWVFSVKDNGIGIDPKYHDRIFVIFQRLHGKTEFSGTGIGLAICKKIVEMHGGRIWVESRAGEGSTFFFTIPLSRSV